MKARWIATAITPLLLSVPSMGAAAATGNAGATPSVLTCAGKVVVRPSTYVLACADANTYFQAIHWRSWTRSSATASATLVANNCLPTCAEGRFLKYPATLELSKPKSTKLGLLFSLVRYRYTVTSSMTLPLTKLG